MVNADGYDLSRSLQNEQKRKNCRITAGVIPTLADCTLAANVNRGIDLNRNYLPFWGGPGSSTSATASNTRGEAPGSEPEIEGMIDLLNQQPGTVAINNHTPDQRLLRAPSSSNEPDVLADEVAYQGLLDRLSKNLPGWPAGPWTDVYYEASSTAEQQAYYAYGAFGFTPEATPGFSGAQTFHPPYQNVIDNYLGTGTRYAGQTMRGLYYDAFKAATEPSLHSVHHRHRTRGREAHADQDLQRSTRASRSGRPDQPAGPRRSRTRSTPTITVPASGKFEWHVNPSLRPSQYDATVQPGVLHAHLHRAGRHRARDARRSRSPAASSSTARCARRAASAARCRPRSALTLGRRLVRRVHAGRRQGLRRRPPPRT